MAILLSCFSPERKRKCLVQGCKGQWPTVLGLGTASCPQLYRAPPHSAYSYAELQKSPENRDSDVKMDWLGRYKTLKQ
jgi:hypothetical protein